MVFLHCSQVGPQLVPIALKFWSPLKKGGFPCKMGAVQLYGDYLGWDAVALMLKTSVEVLGFNFGKLVSSQLMIKPHSMVKAFY